ncbi:MAG: IS1595 family transposase, partial [Thermoplasmatota archaeon]
RYRGVSKNYLQGYLDFLAFLLNEKDQWFEIILSDNSRT